MENQDQEIIQNQQKKKKKIIVKEIEEEEKVEKKDNMVIYIEKLLKKESSEIKEDNTFLLNKQKNHNISDIIPTVQYSKEYKNQEIIDKIVKLSQTLPYYRQIRGDGNCFFRAFGFLLIEGLFNKTIHKAYFMKHPIFSFIETLNSEELVLLKIINCNDKLILPILAKTDNLKEVFINTLYHLILEKHKLNSYTELNKIQRNRRFNQILYQLLNEKPIFDMALIVYIRTITYNFFNENKKNPEYEPFFYDFEDKMAILTTYGEEADNTIIPMTGFAFKKRIIINMLHVDKKMKQTTILQQKYPENDEPLLEFNFFFRPGHYDIFYDDRYVIEESDK